MKRDGDPQPGLAARWPTYCGRCDGAIGPGDRIIFRRGVPVHVACASGADDGGGDE